MVSIPTNYRQVYAIQKKNREKILKICPNMKSESGIYFYTRTDENGIHSFYIGQSVDCMARNISHLQNYSHIDLSIKKRGFYSEDNPYGWKLNVIYYPKEKLDEMEQYWILEYMKKGYQARYNYTGGGQGKGKQQLNEYKQPKTYRQGIQAGYIKASKEISNLFEKYLNYSTKDKVPNRYQLNALDKFQAFLDFHKQEQDKTE